MAARSSGSLATGPSSSGSEPSPLQLPDWVAWLQAGLTALLAVLFLVMLAKAREQGSRIQELQERVQGLENSRALERTTGLEQQLRSTVERLQAVERSTARIDVLSADNNALRSELRQLRRNADSGLPPLSPASPSSSNPGEAASPSAPSGGPTPPPPVAP